VTHPENRVQHPRWWRRVLDLEKRGSPIGKADIVVGAPYKYVGARGAGRAYVFSAADGSLLGTLERPLIRRRGAISDDPWWAGGARRPAGARPLPPSRARRRARFVLRRLTDIICISLLIAPDHAA
jgi:hypothetical protein